MNPELLKTINKPLFEIRGSDGHEWKLYEDGTATGFPDGKLLMANRARAHLAALRGTIIEMERSS